jgi:DNA-binding protein HU-beta
VLLRQTGNEVGMAGGDAIFFERLRHFWNELQQRQPCINVTNALTGFRSNRGHIVPATKLTKAQLIRFMSEQLALSPKQITGVLDLLLETATTQTKKLGEFTIPGLGKLVKAQRAARLGRNPATGETIKIKAKTTVKFRVARATKDAVAPPKA